MVERFVESGVRWTYNQCLTIIVCQLEAWSCKLIWKTTSSPDLNLVERSICRVFRDPPHMRSLARNRFHGAGIMIWRRGGRGYLGTLSMWFRYKHLVPLPHYLYVNFQLIRSRWLGQTNPYNGILEARLQSSNKDPVYGLVRDPPY